MIDGQAVVLKDIKEVGGTTIVINPTSTVYISEVRIPRYLVGTSGKHSEDFAIH